MIDWLTDQNRRARRSVEYSIGWAVREPERVAIAALPTKSWSQALAGDGDVREGAQVAELTGLLDLPGWPACG